MIFYNTEILLTLLAMCIMNLKLFQLAYVYSKSQNTVHDNGMKCDNLINRYISFGA